MCDQAVDDCLAALKFIRDWFVTTIMLEKYHYTLLVNDDTLFSNKDHNKVTFVSNESYAFVVDFDEINIGERNNFDEDSPDTIIYVRLLACGCKF